MLCDLHTHSTFSDSTETPEGIISKARQLRLIVALCDHNTLDGLPRFLAAARREQVTAVAGVEMSTRFSGHNVHVLGLFLPDSCYEPLGEVCRDMSQKKHESIIRLIERLSAGGFSFDEKGLLEGKYGQLNRVSVARALFEGGLFSSIQAAFTGLLDERHGYYRPPALPDTLEIIRLLSRLGAVTALAHPLKSLDDLTLISLLEQSRPAGLDAMETQYSEYTRQQIQKARALAERFGLLESGGSDYHGENKPEISLGTGLGGLRVEKQVYDRLLERSGEKARKKSSL